MKKSLILLMLVTALLGAGIAWAADSVPGSQEDPVVSKSYVDAKTSFAPIQLAAGQSLIGAGGTEIILRSGEATAVDNGADGISDLTSGADIMTGGTVVANHLLLIPRDDGRGITALSEAWVMVKGNYVIQ